MTSLILDRVGAGPPHRALDGAYRAPAAVAAAGHVLLGAGRGVGRGRQGVPEGQFRGSCLRRGHPVRAGPRRADTRPLEASATRPSRAGPTILSSRRLTWGCPRIIFADVQIRADPDGHIAGRALHDRSRAQQLHRRLGQGLPQVCRCVSSVSCAYWRGRGNSPTSRVSQRPPCRPCRPFPNARYWSGRDKQARQVRPRRSDGARPASCRRGWLTSG